MPAGQPLDPRSPERPSVAGMQRQLDRTVGQLDRRIPPGGEPEAVVKYIGPDEPGHKRGRFWLRPRTGEATT